MDLTSKLKDSAIVSAIPIPKISTRISIFGSPGSEYKGTNSESAFEAWNSVMTADEATELPPVVALPPEDLVCTLTVFFNKWGNLVLKLEECYVLPSESTLLEENLRCLWSSPRLQRKEKTFDKYLTSLWDEILNFHSGEN